MKKFLTLLVLLAFSGLALATSSEADGTFDPAAVHDYTDKSIFYLSQLFGTVGGVLTGQSSQMMGQIFYKLNWGLFIVSGIVVLYAVLLAAIRLASEGVVIQQGKSALFSLIKIAIGVSLIIPNSGTGYSLLQNLVMTVVVKGVALADSVWDYGLDYLNEGGVLWSAPTDNAEDGNSRYDNIITEDNENALIGAKEQLAPQIFANAVCMVGSHDPLSSSSSDDNRPYYDVQVDQENHLFRFPGLTDNDLSGSSCGTVSWDVQGSCSQEGGDSISCATAQGAVSSLINVLIPAAKSYYCTEAGSDSQYCKTVQDYDNLNEDLSPVLFNSMMNYYPTIKVYADMKLAQIDGDSKNFIDNAKAQGWIMAGRYYWNVMQFINDSGEAADLSTYTGAEVVPPSAQGLGATDDLKGIVNGAAKAFSDVYPTQDYTDYKNSVYTQVNGSGEGTKGEDRAIIDKHVATAIVGATALAPGVSATLAVAMKGMDKIGDMFKSFGTKNYNPIEFMFKVGKKCIEVTMAIWIVGGVAIGLNVVAGAVCSASNPYGYAVQALADWVKPILMVIAAGLWAAGFFLSYYIPLYPYMTFLFASVGWFISVIEAMVAAPLVALGLTHPEDHDLLGKSQQAVMLLLGVFLQPVLLVIGLIAGMIFCYVSFQLLIYSFSGFMLDILRDSSQLATNSNILSAVVSSKLFTDSGILIQPLLIVVFAMIAYILLTQSYSLIYVLRDNVMKWIGAPASGLQSPEQLTGQIKEAIQGYGSKIGDAQGQTAMNSAESAHKVVDNGKNCLPDTNELQFK